MMESYFTDMTVSTDTEGFEKSLFVAAHFSVEHGCVHSSGTLVEYTLFVHLFKQMVPRSGALVVQQEVLWGPSVLKFVPFSRM